MVIRVQIIPGDTCTLEPGSKIASWLVYVQEPCTGHEEDSGYDLTVRHCTILLLACLSLSLSLALSCCFFLFDTLCSHQARHFLLSEWWYLLVS